VRAPPWASRESSPRMITGLGRFIERATFRPTACGYFDGWRSSGMGAGKSRLETGLEGPWQRVDRKGQTANRTAGVEARAELGRGDGWY